MNTTQAPILVTGGTGTLGRLVVGRLRDAGHDVRVLSRHGGSSADGIQHMTGDLATDEGIDAAVKGIEVIVHAAGSTKGDEDKAAHLVQAASRAGGRPHVVNISVVGADRVPIVGRVDRAMFGYFASKLAAERVIADSGLPWTTLRASQFHDLLLRTAQGLSKLPLLLVPGVRFQPVDADEVAARLVELALAGPVGLVPELAGPRIYELKEVVRGYLRASGKHRLILPIRLPGKAAAAFRAGANLAPNRAVGRRTWEEFLAERVGSPTDSAREARLAAQSR